LNELPGYAGRGKFLKCSVANINKFAAADSGGDQKFDRPSKSFVWGDVDVADEQFGNPRNGYRSTRRRAGKRDRQMERRRHSHRGNSREYAMLYQSLRHLTTSTCPANVRIREA
jgi:hypothetical protein